MSRVYRYSVWLYDDACYVQVFINKIYFLFWFGFKFSSNIKKTLFTLSQVSAKNSFGSSRRTITLLFLYFEFNVLIVTIAYFRLIQISLNIDTNNLTT